MLISSLFFLNPDVKSIFDRTMAWFDTFFSFWAEELFYLKRSNFALFYYWFDSFYQWLTSDLTGCPKALKCYSSWRRWSAIQYVLRAWFGNPSLSSNFLKTPELNSVGTKTDVYLILIKNHQKICQITKIWTKNRLANLWSSSKLTSQATKRWKKIMFSNRRVRESGGGGGGWLLNPMY